MIPPTTSRGWTNVRGAGYDRRMRAFDANDAELFVFTYKEGLLSKVAHDLKIQARRLKVEIDADLNIALSVEVRGLRVLDAMQKGRRNPELLSSKDKLKIEDTLCSKDVLDAKAHPTITFESSAVKQTEGGYDVQGNLTIRGRTVQIQAEVEATEDRLETEVRLHQPDFGIAPFSALLGTLKVKPGVKVRLSVPRELS